MTRKGLLIVLLLLVSASLVFAGGTGEGAASSKPVLKAEIPQIPRATVKLAIGPYLDHSFVVIGVKKGWFDEVGVKITPEPFGRIVLTELYQAFQAGTVDVIRSFDIEFAAMTARTTDAKIFAVADFYQGYAILGPGNKYKSVSDFMSQGQSWDDALHSTLVQMKGQKFGVPTDIAARSFHNLVFKLGNFNPADVNMTVVEDPQVVQLALSNRVDFAGPGGAPLIVTLKTNGWTPLVTAGQIVAHAKASFDSPELRGVGSAGWAASTKWLQANHDTALRMMSVLYRIMDLYHDNPQDALETQLPYLNSIAGTNLTPETAMQIIDFLDPFYTFEGQLQFFGDPNNPLYYAWRYGGHLQMYKEQGVIKKNLHPDVTYVAQDFFAEMFRLRYEASGLIRDTTFGLAFLPSDKKSSKNATTGADLLEKAKMYFAHRNYLDAQRFASAALAFAQLAER